jgi:hypothetical protein
VYQKPEPIDSAVEVHQQVPGHLGHPLADRVRGDAGQVHPPPIKLDDEQHVQPVNPTVSTVRKSQTSTPAA